ncbi:MAG TPA: TolC family protein [Pirellulaceae bacterium]|nr:TolC family protein [Pirellulaceae bacterium]
MKNQWLLWHVFAWIAMVGCVSPPDPTPQLSSNAKPPSLTRLPTITDIASPTSPTHIADNTRLVTHREPIIAPADVAGSVNPDHLLFAGATSIDELVGFAIGNNPEIASARARAEAMMSRIPQARSLDDPMLTTTVFLEEIQTAAGPQELLVSLSQKFPWFGKLDARGEMAFHDAQVAYAELANVELGVVEQVKLAYLDLYFIDQSLRVYQDLEQRLQDVIAITRTRFETNAPTVGLESVLQAEVTLEKLYITVAELEQARIKAAARLRKALSLPRGTGLDIEPQLVESHLPLQMDSLLAMIEQCNPVLEARRQAIVRDEWSIDLAQRNYYPDVNVGFNWAEIGDRGLSAAANGRDAYSLMVGVNLPIYKRKLDAAVDEARFRMTQSSQQYDATWNAIRADIEKLHAAAVEHQRVLEILNTTVLQKAEQTFDLSIEAYRVDRIGFQQLIDNYEALLRFRIDRHFRVTSREQAIAQLERTLGCAVASSQPQLEPVPLPDH